MNIKLLTDRALKSLTAMMLAAALVLTFTLSDYYIFNRIGEFGFFFVLCQWVKKAGYLLIPLAVFYKKKCCADIAKYVLPVFIIVSFCTFGGFFDATTITAASSGEDITLAHLNGFMPKAANMTLFFIAGFAELFACAALFIRDGWKVSGKSFIFLPFAIFAVMPLNLFENFFTIDSGNIAEWQASFLWFKNFTLWHFLALAALAGFTVGAYYFLKRKDRKTQQVFLVAAAIVLLIQYHSKDSMLLGDGYNVYYTVFACIPLFICNIGVYVACLSVILKKRVLYSISFFVHAVGALTVFVYFGKDEMSNYGIFCSYSILYFCLTHCLLFALSVMPTALGHYKFRIKDCITPMIYYCLVIIVATVASGLVSTFLQEYNYNGFGLPEYTLASPPNYAFTQVNPLPIPFDYIPFTIGKHTFYLSYLIALYAAYVGLFWAFTGAYYAFLAIRRRLLKGKTAAVPVVPIPTAEIAATDMFENGEKPSVDKAENTDEKSDSERIK